MSNSSLTNRKVLCRFKTASQILLVVLLPAVVFFLFIPVENRKQILEAAQSNTPAAAVTHLPTLDATQVWTLFGIAIFGFFAPNWRSIVKRITTFKIGSVGIEIDNLQKRAVKSERNEHYLYGNLFSYHHRWTEAADMFQSMRESPDIDVRLSGLVESAILIVSAYDSGKSIFELNGMPINSYKKKETQLEIARKFCDEALWIAQTKDEVRHRIPFVYFKRAIVNSRLAIHLNEANSVRASNAKKGALNDLRRAIARDRDFLLQATFDERLRSLANGKTFKLDDSSMVVFSLSTEMKSLEDKFLKLGTSQ